VEAVAAEACISGDDANPPFLARLSQPKLQPRKCPGSGISQVDSGTVSGSRAKSRGTEPNSSV
jgi:hypothetical protein